MGLIDKSKTSNTTVQNFTEANTVGASDGSIAAYNSFVNVLDGGAIKEAFGFGDSALDFAGRAINDSIAFSGDALNRVLDYSEAVTLSGIDNLSRSFSDSTRALSANAASVINKATLDSGERVQSTVKMMAWVVGIGMALLFASKVWKK